MIGRVCTFTVTRYGTSGNELPPRPEGGFVYSILSEEDETALAFSTRMQQIGMQVRKALSDNWAALPRPYSCASTCDWVITEVHSVGELLGRAVTHV